MPFGLYNAGAIFQRLVNKMFKDQIGKTMEVYIDNMVVKYVKAENHVHDLQEGLSDRCKLFYDVLRKSKGFTWSEKHEAALHDLKNNLTTPPLLSKPLQGEDIYIYLSVIDHAVSGVLVKEGEGVQSSVYYVSKSLVEAETRYTSLEKLVLALAMTSVKL
ncbi:uncharacterized protein LOC141719071 [Apium graveolens]|uniref:uncharacterized protein LOC141719071 n=1 Tax=Apium graveolens TaxID=4045 RepID=UPI003D7BDFAF